MSTCTGYLGSLRAKGTETEIHRLIAFAPFGLMLIQLLSAYYPPRKLLNPLRWQFYLSLLGLAAILASGFRSGLAFALGCAALAAWFHRGWREVIFGGIMGALLLGFLVFGQGRLFDLPLPAQRALGSFPGQWDESVKGQVETSNSRWDWWRQIVAEGAVKNWWIGDGFGVSERDYESIIGGRVNFEQGADITGALHNGPLTTIRYAGAVGLVLFYALMIAGAVSSVKCVRRCRGTPLFPVALFLAMQLVWTPIQYTFLFGGYDAQLPEQLFLTALLTLVRRMSDRPPPSTEPAVIARPFSRNSGGTRFPHENEGGLARAFPIPSLEPEVHIRQKPATGHVAEYMGVVCCRRSPWCKGAFSTTRIEREQLRTSPGNRAIRPLQKPSPPHPSNQAVGGMQAGVPRDGRHGRAFSIDSYTSSVSCATTRGA